MSLSYLCADGHKQAVTHIRESQQFKLMYTLQGKPDQHATGIPRSIHVWSQTICISRGQCIATFRQSSIELDRVTIPEEKEFPTTSPTHRLTDLWVPI
jgi:hypothetical protein